MEWTDSLVEDSDEFDDTDNQDAEGVPRIWKLWPDRTYLALKEQLTKDREKQMALFAPNHTSLREVVWEGNISHPTFSFRAIAFKGDPTDCDTPLPHTIEVGNHIPEITPDFFKANIAKIEHKLELRVIVPAYSVGRDAYDKLFAFVSAEPSCVKWNLSEETRKSIVVAFMIRIGKGKCLASFLQHLAPTHTKPMVEDTVYGLIAYRR
ncbi:hypothetical protein HKX48_004340 [Thoreauomyces humboldtii]|nr:hypothetical protein HKX48_004340 [Thoreauomyces humboldtii]